MQGQHLFEYAVIRIVPQVEREEFLNVGVILYCPRPPFLRTIYHLNETRLQAFTDKLDVAEIQKYLSAFDRISQGKKEAGPIARLPVAERFRWLTATRSTVLQTSRIHPGFCADPQEMLVYLYTQLVL